QFDLSAFHTQVQNSSSIPLEVLEKKTDRWIKSQLANDFYEEDSIKMPLFILPIKKFIFIANDRK
ncbi:MAG: hypothetical protein OQK74_01395, partial [Gammaproteobacteria bacterium]|nr:hypothetical protein [Gammaproteobacteria bacterium]